MPCVSLLMSLVVAAAPLAVDAAVTPSTGVVPAPAAASAAAAPTPSTMPAPDAASLPPPTGEQAHPAPAPVEPVAVAGPPPIPPQIDLTTPAPNPWELRRRRLHRWHHGFYLRGALGFSGFSDTVFSKTQRGDESRDEAYLGGFGTASELSIGGSLGRGFVLGGGVYSASIFTSTYSPVRGNPLPDALQRPSSFTIAGIMADWYPHPQTGFHMQASLGFAALSGLDLSTPRFRSRDPAVGGGVMLGFGYEWHATESWGVGVLARATAGIVSEKDDLGERWFHLATASPSLLFTATYY